MANLKPLDNEFALFAVRKENDSLNINFLKITLDWKVWYDVPQSMRSSMLPIYKPITEGSCHVSFVKYASDKLKDGLDNPWSRKYRLKLRNKDGTLSKESAIFYDNNLKAKLNGVPLVLSKSKKDKEEEDKDRDKDDKDIDDLDLSIEELTKVFGM